MTNEIGHAWQAYLSGTVAERTAIAAQTTDPEVLATVAPGIWDDAPTDFVHTVLDNPACSSGLASRYTRHPDPEVRYRVTTWPTITAAALMILERDSDQRVADRAAERLGQIGAFGIGPTGCHTSSAS